MSQKGDGQVPMVRLMNKSFCQDIHMSLLSRTSKTHLDLPQLQHKLNQAENIVKILHRRAVGDDAASNAVKFEEVDKLLVDHVGADSEEAVEVLWAGQRETTVINLKAWRG
jgi:hypothetical protein